MKCLVPACNNEQHVKGLCRNCYQTAYIAVKAGKLSWADLEKNNLALPTKRKRTPIYNTLEDICSMLKHNKDLPGQMNFLTEAPDGTVSN